MAASSAGPGLGGPRVLRLAPADAHRDGRRRGLHRGGHRVDEALVGVGREVDHLGGSRGHRAGHLDVELHLAVRAVGVLAGHVAGAVDALGRHRRDGEAEAGKVGVQVAGGEAAAQLDDPDRLPGAVGAGRELVDLGHLGRGVGGRGGRFLVMAPVVVPGLRPVVQAEHAHHDAVELGRYLQRAHAVPVRRPVPVTESRAGDQGQLGAEHGGQRGHRARHGDPAGAGVPAGHLQPEPGQGVGHQVQVGRIGAVPPPQCLPGDPDRRARGVERQFRAPPGHHGDLDALGPVDGPGRLGVRHRTALAAGQRHKRLVWHVPPQSSCRRPVRGAR